MAVRSKITIFNAALLRTGNSDVTEGDGSFIWQALEANYDEIVREAFEGQEYTFGKKRIVLTSRTSGDFGYEDGFVYPSEVIHIVDVYLNDIRASDLGESWEVDASANKILIDARERTVAIEVIRVGLESTWSAKFTRGIQRRLEAVIKSVEEEEAEADMLDAKADVLFLRAGVKSSKNRSEERIRRGGRLTQAHRGYRRR